MSQAVTAVKGHLLPTGPRQRRVLLGPARGAVLPLDYAHHTRLAVGLYELEVNRHLRRLCEGVTTAFDVGAQIGYDALIMARMTKGRVVSFEADEVLADQLLETFARNDHLGASLTARHAFVGSTDGPGRVTLDSVAFGEGPVPELIKVDVEGGEADVLAGAARTLREVRPHLIIETHSWALEQACGRILCDHGYRPLIVHQRVVLRDHRPLEHNRWLVAVGQPTSAR